MRAIQLFLRLAVATLVLAGCTQPAGSTDDRDRAIQELARRAGAPVAVERDALGTTRVVAMTPDHAAPGLATDPATAAAGFVLDHHDVFGLDPQEAAEFVVARVDVDRAIAHVTLQRTIDGVPVFQGGLQLAVDAGNHVLHVTGDEHYRVGAPTNRLTLSPAAAALAVGTQLGVPLVLHDGTTEGLTTSFVSPGVLEPVRVEPRIFQVARGDDRFAHQVLLSWQGETDGLRYELVVVDGQTGELLGRTSLVHSFTGRVFSPASQPGANPVSDTRTVVSFNGNATASQLGWVDSNRKTIGNNATACTDLDGNHVCGANEIQPTADASDAFDFPYTPTQNPSNFKAAAVSNAFFYINDWHDRTYALGFTEAAGNFQQSNFGLGGAGNDSVKIEVESATGSINFACPPDGSQPRLVLSSFAGGSPPNRDSAYDGSIVYHEMTHGLSNRLVGGGSTTCLTGLQSGGMGEGWGDFLAASFLNNPVIGAYLNGNATFGIRRMSMASSTFTYNDVKNGTLSFSHDVGELWAAALWDVRTRIGATTTEQLVVRGMKLTPCNPTMLAARDAMLSADAIANGGVNRCALWTAFAGRLMGLGASSPNHNSFSSIVTSDTVPSECAPGNDFSIAASPSSRVVTAGVATTTTYTINTAVMSGVAQSIALSATGLPAGVTGSFSPATITAGASSTLTLTISASAVAAMTSFTITGTSPTKSHPVSASLTLNHTPVVAITAPTSGATLHGVVTIAATASDPDGTVTSVRFDLPGGTSVTKNAAPFTTTWDSTAVADASGYVIQATATDNFGATAMTLVTVGVSNCINGTFAVTGPPIAIPDNNPISTSSPLAVVGSGVVASVALSLNITHTFRGDLLVTLRSPGGTSKVLFNHTGAGADDIMVVNMPINGFANLVAAGTWVLEVEDDNPGNVGTLNSWSLAIVGSCL